MHVAMTLAFSVCSQFAKSTLIEQIGESWNADLFHGIRLVATDRMSSIREAIKRPVGGCLSQVSSAFITSELVGWLSDLSDC